MDYLQKKRANTLPKIYKILDDIFYNGKMHGLTVCEAKNLSMVYGDLLFENSSIFFQKKIADILIKNGISVKMDKNNVNYIACLLDD